MSNVFFFVTTIRHARNNALTYQRRKLCLYDANQQFVALHLRWNRLSVVKPAATGHYFGPGTYCVLQVRAACIGE